MNNNDRLMLAETVPPRILPKVLTKFDLAAIYFSIIFGSYGAAQLASKGWLSIPVLLISVITFLVPCAVAAYELGTVFTGEGGIYIWAHKAFGPVHGFIAGWLSWIPIFLLLPLGATAIIAHIQLILGTHLSIFSQVVCQISVVWVVTAISMARITYSQRYILIFSIVSFSIGVILLVVATISNAPIELTKNNLDHTSQAELGVIYAAAVLWIVGVEVPFNQGAEFKEHRHSARFMMIWGTIALLLGYICGIAGILSVIPTGNVDATTGIADAAYKLSPFFGSLICLLIVFAVSSQDVAYMNSYSRFLLVSGIEKRLPKAFASVDSRQVPRASLITQAIGSSVVLLLFSTQPNLATAFNMYLAALTAVWCASLYYIFLAIPRVRRIYAHEYVNRKKEIWIIPYGKTGLCITTLAGLAFNSLAIFYVFANPWAENISRTTWQLWLLAICALIILSGYLIFQIGDKSMEKQHNST